jgi:RNA polymerase sigma factor (sigma-70 family)
MASADHAVAIRHLRTLFDAATTVGLTDGQLLDLFETRRDEAAFTVLIERHGPMVQRVCGAVLGNHHDTEDVFQATFFVLARHAGSIRRRQSLASWLYGVALRISMCVRSASGRRRKHERNWAALRASQAGNEEETQRDFAPLLHAEIGRLAERYRAPVVLCYLQGRTYEEAARLLRCPVGTIKSRLATARQRLRHRLEGLEPASLAGLIDRAQEGPPTLVAVPARLLETTAHAVMPGAGGDAVPVAVTRLAERVLSAMFLKRLSASATFLIAVGALATYVTFIGDPEPFRPLAVPVPIPFSHAEEQGQRAPRPESPPLSLLLVGKVEDSETKRPIAGATVLVHRLVPGLVDRDAPPWAGGTTMQSDDRGRFKIVFPPQQVADSRVHFSVKVSHSDYVSRVSRLVSLADLDCNRRFGDRPSLGTIALERGIEYMAHVVTPGGTPAAGVDCEFSNSGGIPGENPFCFLSDDFKGRTDDQGRIRLRMPGGSSSQTSLQTTPANARNRANVAARETFVVHLTINSERYPKLRWVWRLNRPSREGNRSSPRNLGRIALSSGVVLSGRLLDVTGRPLPRQSLTAQESSSGDQRSVVTDLHGRFTFAPLDHGTYTICAEAQSSSGVWDTNSKPLTPKAAIVYPVRLNLKTGVTPEPVDLREPPCVTIEARALDSQGRPVRYSPVELTGLLPERNDSGGAATERIDRATGVRWGARSAPDSEGRVILRAPRGLSETYLYTTLPDPTISVRIQLSKNDAPRIGGRGLLGALNEDRRDVTLTYYKSPIVLISVKSARGELLSDAEVRGRWTTNGETQGVTLLRLPDGRFRTSGMPPDQACMFMGYAEGYESNEASIKLPEKAVEDITLELKKQDVND